MIQVSGLSFSYGSRPVLHDVSFSLSPGQLMGVLGNNGAGKSTLITCLNRIRTPCAGSVSIDGQNVLSLSRLEAARQISYVGQSSVPSQMTVFDCVLLGRRPYLKWSVTQDDLSLCQSVLRQTGLEPLQLRPLNQLSGGELQKAMLARALVQQPKLLLLDEPTSSLDPRNQHEVMELIRQVVSQRNIAGLIVIHDLNLALRYCSHFLLLRDGRVYACGGPEVMTGDAIFQVYGIHGKVLTVDGQSVALFA